MISIAENISTTMLIHFNDWCLFSCSVKRISKWYTESSVIFEIFMPGWTIISKLKIVPNYPVWWYHLLKVIFSSPRERHKISNINQSIMK
jgi:hypothetical protein